METPKKILATFILVGLISTVASAADRYNYECEEDAGGAEGLCLAVPKDMKQAKTSMQDKGRPPRDRSKMIADQPQEKSEDAFRASDVVSSEANTNQSDLPTTENLDGAAANITAQEKIRQVEQFLQPIKGPGGFGTDDGPAKAGK